MELASFNRFDGPRVVRDLLNNLDLWEACVMDREAWLDIEFLNLRKTRADVNLYKLRDMRPQTTSRLGRSYWNVDTLFILPKSGKSGQLRRLASTWHADQIDCIKGQEAKHMLGGDPGPILRIYWD